MPGGAYLSGCEFSKELLGVDIPERAMNRAIVLSEVKGSKAEMQDLINQARLCFRDRSKNIATASGLEKIRALAPLASAKRLVKVLRNN